MKRPILFFLILISLKSAFAQNKGVGIGTTNTHATALLELKDTARGFLPPRMTSAQRDAIVNPAQGLMIYCTNCSSRGEAQIYNGTSWGKLSTAAVSAPVYNPVVTTDSVRSITADMAKVFLTLVNSGTIGYTGYGICWSKTPEPTRDLSTKLEVTSGAGSVITTPVSKNFQITLLEDTSIYYVRAYFITDYALSYGNQLVFTTLKGKMPVVTTKPISGVTSWSANSGIKITSAGNTALSQVGVCWSKSPNPTVALSTKTVQTINSGSDSVNSFFNSLESSTLYYLRAYATTSTLGTVYGSQFSFTTLPLESGRTACGAPKVLNDTITYGLVTDIDGNSYKTVFIRGKEWMAENLRVSRYNDGTALTSVYGAFSGFVNNDSASNNCPYGRIYNGYAAISGKLCPSGWRVASANDFLSVDSSWGGISVSGGKMKSVDTTMHWAATNIADNASGLSVLPFSRGYSYIDLWTSTYSIGCPYTAGECWTNFNYRRFMAASTATTYITTTGTSELKAVRCVKVP